MINRKNYISLGFNFSKFHCNYIVNGSQLNFNNLIFTNKNIERTRIHGNFRRSENDPPNDLTVLYFTRVNLYIILMAEALQNTTEHKDGDDNDKNLC